MFVSPCGKVYVPVGKYMFVRKYYREDQKVVTSFNQKVVFIESQLEIQDYYIICYSPVVFIESQLEIQDYIILYVIVQPSFCGMLYYIPSDVGKYMVQIQPSGMLYYIPSDVGKYMFQVQPSDVVCFCGMFHRESIRVNQKYRIVLYYSICFFKSSRVSVVCFIESQLEIQDYNIICYIILYSSRI